MASSALLISLLLPALNGARRSAYASACASQLRQIGFAVRAYAEANHGYLHRAPNQATWLKVWQPPGESNDLRLIDPNDTTAYWGAAYLPYQCGHATAEATGDGTRQIVQFARRVWFCPSSKSVDPAFGNIDPDNPVSYGVNFLICQGTSFIGPAPTYTIVTTWSKLASVPTTRSGDLRLMTRWSPRLENKQRNMLSAYGTKSNLTDWRPGGANYSTKTDAVYEYYRHSHSSNVLVAGWPRQRHRLLHGHRCPAGLVRREITSRRGTVPRSRLVASSDVRWRTLCSASQLLFVIVSAFLIPAIFAFHCMTTTAAARASYPFASPSRKSRCRRSRGHRY